ncbi:MAG: hypothetical protein IKN65_04375 [Clostridia bacterium]|nr:hypothetical protein [Clostridia bacterium]
MKKLVKGSLLLMVVAIMLMALTGCGKNKLVATKSNSSENSLLGAYDEKIEITFKKDKADKIVWTMEFEDESKAKSAAGLYQMASSEIEGLEVKQDGKKVVLNMSVEAYAKTADMKDEDLSRDAFKKELEDEGYTVK